MSTKEKILEVTKVKATRLTGPVRVDVQADGKVSTPGWEQPELRAREHKTAPADGMYAFDFVARRPSGVRAQPIHKIKAETVLMDPPSWVRGIRVHASNNSQEVKLIAAGAKAKAPA